MERVRKVLPICGRCGWQMIDEGDHRRNPNQCDEKAGRFAKRLVKESPVPATMHGYGNGYLTFKLGKHQSITFYLRKNVGMLSHVHWLAAMDAEKVLAFIGKLNEIANPAENR